MNIFQFSKLLQISGIVIGTGFGTILLNPEVVGRLAHFINKKLLIRGDNLKERYKTVFKYFFPKSTDLFVPADSLGANQIILNAWILLFYSLTRETQIMFWFSLSFLVVYTFLAGINKLPRIFEIIPPKRWSLESIFGRIISSLIINPIIVFTLSFLTLVVLTTVFVLNSIAKRDVLRRGLIISGFILVLTGLILEYFVID